MKRNGLYLSMSVFLPRSQWFQPKRQFFSGTVVWNSSEDFLNNIITGENFFKKRLHLLLEHASAAQQNEISEIISTKKYYFACLIMNLKHIKYSIFSPFPQLLPKEHLKLQRIRVLNLLVHSEFKQLLNKFYIHNRSFYVSSEFKDITKCK